MKRHLSLLLALLLLQSAFAQQSHTRGIGIYPGRPSEYFGPTFATDNTLRNLALHRAVYQSSAHDKNLTAQLLTDGEFATGEPAHLVVRRNGVPLSTAERQLTLNQSEWSSIAVQGSKATLSYEWNVMEIEADEVVVEGYVAYDDRKECDGYTLTCNVAAEHGKTYSARLEGSELPGTPYSKKVSSDPNKQMEGEGKPARALKETFSLRGNRRFNRLTLTLNQGNALYWSVKEVTLRRNGKLVQHILPADHFSSVWLTDGPEWAYVDLGCDAVVSDVKLFPVTPSGTCSVDFSSDARTWHPAGRVSLSKGRTAMLRIGAQARYVRIATSQAAAISEMEVYGRGGQVVVPQPEAGYADGRYLLNGGPWTLCPVRINGKKVEPCGPEIVATVPATVLSSYRNAGALPDPNFDDQLSMISESYFNRPFRYRRTFRVPDEMKDRHVLLHLDGINWKADVYLNGNRLGQVRGAFRRGTFDIAEYLEPGDNQLEVVIHPTAHPGARKTKTRLNTSFNGGVLGADNPTFHATIGWDWITTTPGRDIGIWNDVYLTATEAVTIADPLVETQLSDDGRATFTPRVFLRNHSRETVTGRLTGTIGDIRFEKDILINPQTETEVAFSPASFPQLRQQEMQLWWPVGYGEPHLYPASYTFRPTSTRSELPVELHYQTGIRQVTFSQEMEQLQLFVNGRRLVPLGGNWGFPESHLNYRGREYDAAVEYHRLMNCNMIRNWVGQTGDEEFYEACDRHGVMVWQDFWLANPVDGPNPDDERMFMDNATDYVRRIRQHPCLALFCGRNEGYPPETINSLLPKMTSQLISGSLYIPSSADDGVSGHGPYQARPVAEYFEKQTGKLHTERGMPNIPEAESMRRMIAPENLWPQADAWGQHDFTQQGAQAGASFNRILRERFGPLRVGLGQDSLAAYTAMAQWQNYDGYRAMYEASNTQRQGLLIWMSHPCWPSTVWQTYDYYLAPTAALFGVRKACEPLHAQWNALTGMVQLVNLCLPAQVISLTATIHDLHGFPLWHRTVRVESRPDTTIDCFHLDAPLGYEGTYFLTLTLGSEEPAPLPTKNVYVLSTNDSQQDLFGLPQAQLAVERQDDGRLVVTNTGSEPAVMVRLNLTGSDGEQILPVFYSENYFHLMPGEQMPVSIRWHEEDTRGTAPMLRLSGLNVPTTQVGL